jgi:hypothetical protein
VVKLLELLGIRQIVQSIPARWAKPQQPGIPGIGGPENCFRIVG